MDPAGTLGKAEVAKMKEIVGELTAQLKKVDRMKKINLGMVKEAQGFLVGKDSRSGTFAEGRNVLEWLKKQWVEIGRFEETTQAMLDHIEKQLVSGAGVEAKFGPQGNFGGKKGYCETFSLTSDSSGQSIGFSYHGDATGGSPSTSASYGKKDKEVYETFTVESLHEKAANHLTSEESELDEGSGYRSEDEVSTLSFTSSGSSRTSGSSVGKSGPGQVMNQTYLKPPQTLDDTFAHSEVREFDPEEGFHSTLLEDDSLRKGERREGKVYGHCPSCNNPVVITYASPQKAS